MEHRILEFVYRQTLLSLEVTQGRLSPQTGFNKTCDEITLHKRCYKGISFHLGYFRSFPPEILSQKSSFPSDGGIISSATTENKKVCLLFDI